MRKKLKQLMIDLCSMHGVPGLEQELAVYLRDRIKDYADEVRVDSFGNVFAYREGSSDTNGVMIPAHMDEVGLIVKGVDDNGFLRFTSLGYPNPQVLSGSKVKVGGRHIGVVGARSWHTASAEEKEKLPKEKDLFVDVGAKSVEEIKRMGVWTGTPISFISELEQLGQSDRFAGKAIDDRLGCAVLVLVLEALSATDLKVPIYGCFTVQEEVGLQGARIAVRSINPKFSLVLDAPLAEDTPDQGPTSQSSISIGKGVTINVREFAPNWLQGTVHHPALVDYVVNVAEKKGIPHQIGLLIGGITDAAAIQVYDRGVPTLWIGAPVRYAHSYVETFDINDAVSAVDLVRETILSVTPETEFKLI